MSYTPYSHLLQSFSLSLFLNAYPIGDFDPLPHFGNVLYSSQIFQLLLLAC